ncbi:MAG: family transcriptional regulator [Caballeronia mineralivorans]|nr:family transcriptional regulator [Caballeronia mineralivorans]
MIDTAERLPAPKAILQAWAPFKKLIGVTSVRTEADYAKAMALIDELLDEVGDDEAHPLAEVLDLISTQAKAYEDEHVQIPEAEPREVLRFLMDQHDLKQGDLADVAPQNRISEILNGTRPISKEIAKGLAKRFHVHADLFL